MPEVFKKDNVKATLDTYAGLYVVALDSPSGKDLRAYKREENARAYFDRLKLRYRLTQLKLV